MLEWLRQRRLKRGQTIRAQSRDLGLSHVALLAAARRGRVGGVIIVQALRTYRSRRDWLEICRVLAGVEPVDEAAEDERVLVA